jgi:predicted  nucleic acid-binding Zn-ribbon protein
MSLAQLWQLQQLELAREKETRQLNKQFLKELSKEKEKLLARQEELKQARIQLEKLVKQHKRQGRDLEELEAKKRDLSEELYSGRVANPKELSHLEEQVQAVEAKLQTMLEEYLELEEKVASMENNIQEKQNNLTEDMNSYNQKARAAKGDWQAAKSRIEALDGEIEKVAAQIDPSLLAQYRRLQQRLGISVLATVQDGVCGGCSIKLPSLFCQQVKQGETIKCENCGRLLVIS